MLYLIVIIKTYRVFNATIGLVVINKLKKCKQLQVASIFLDNIQIYRLNILFLDGSKFLF